MKPDFMQLADAVWCDLANEGATRDQQTEIIARALLDAHQRGKEEGRAEGRREGMEEANSLISDIPLGLDPDIDLPDFVNGSDYAIGIASTAIRAKAQEVT